MKTTPLFLVFAMLLLSLTNVSAQYGNNGYGNGYGGNGYGRNGGMSQMNQQSQPEKPKEIPAEETVAKIMENMKPALKLDELQSIAISNVLIESIKEQGILLKQKDYNQEEQMKNFKALAETTDRKINQFLSKEQKEQYIAFKEELKKPKKSKDKKSKSKDKKEKQE